MITSDTKTGRLSGRYRSLHAVLFVLGMISFALHDSNARAASLTPVDYRVLAAGGEFDNTWQYAVAFRMRPPRRLRARHLELALGAISTSQETRPFVSLGPVWRFPIYRPDFFVSLGFSPTLIGGSSFNGRDLGGNFHFTSSVAVGATFGQRENISVSLRFQHTSNGGLRDTNPGLDMFGLSFSYDFSDR